MDAYDFDVGPGAADGLPVSEDDLPRGVAELQRTDAIFRALAHPTRRQILLVLHFRGGEMGAGEIAGRFNCKWPTVSRHLAELVASGAVEQRREGRERIYSLNRSYMLAIAGSWLRWFRTENDQTPA